MIIIIPMAGLSSRFAQEGFIIPKYMLHVGDQSLFRLSVTSFERYLKTAKFIFIIRDIFDTRTFVEKECKLIGIDNYELVVIGELTRGQAETVYIGTKKAGLSGCDPILIFNIDTIRKQFEMPPIADLWDGFLEVFVGSGENWSYAKTESAQSTRVVETAEKRCISDYCSNGIYYFKRANDYWRAFELEETLTSSARLPEFYIAPLYNTLIADGNEIHIQITDLSNLSFCGVPAEYHALQKLFYCGF